jgi:hypothetical protein
MRSKHSDRFAKYYLQLEVVYFYYQKYEKAYLNHMLSGKDEKIDRLQEELKEQARLAEIERQEAKERDRISNEKFEKLISMTNTALEELDDVKEVCEDTKQELAETRDAMDRGITGLRTIIAKACDNIRAPDIDRPKERPEFVLVQNNKNVNEFKFLRGTKKYNDNAMKTLFKGDCTMITRQYDANPVTLFNLIKATIRDDLKMANKTAIKKNMNSDQKILIRNGMVKVEIKSNDIKLKNGFTPSQLYELIDMIYIEKYDAYRASLEHSD